MSAITVTDLNNAQLDVNHIAALATSPAPLATDRAGNTKKTMTGVLASMGYMPPVVYASGLSMTAGNQTVSYQANSYAPIVSALPFTTSGAFETANFRLIQGVTAANLALVTGADGVGWAQSGVGAVPRTVRDKLRESASPEDYFVAGEADMHLAIVRAIAAARTVRFPSGGTYNISVSAHGQIKIPDNTTLDLMGSTIKDIGTPFAQCHMFMNAGYGTTVNSNITIKNGTIAGCGSNNNTQDQGHGIAFWKTQNVTLKDLRIKDTAADGFSGREAYDTSLRRLRIGNFGRNGISPTSGSFYWDDVVLDGVPFTGANPGTYIDAENDSATETGTHRMNKVISNGITFVDFHDGATFNHNVIMTNCEFGTPANPAYLGIRLLNQSPNTALKTADTFIIGSGVKSHSTSGACVQLQKVAGIKIVGKPVFTGVNTQGITIVGACSDITIDAAFGAGINYQLFCYTDGVDTLSNSKISGITGEVYLQGTGNLFKSSDITRLTLKNAATSGNTFAIDARVAAITYLTSAPAFAPTIHRTLSVDLPDSTGPYVVDIPVPSGATSGKAYKVMAAWTHKGYAAHYAQCDVVVGLGAGATGILQTISSTAGAGLGIVVSCPDMSTIRLTLTYSYVGTFSATVIG